jgi:hypothetical protein
MKVQIDKFFAENYDKLIAISQSKITYFKRNIDPQTLVANSYLYVIERNPKTAEEIPMWAVNYINTELCFYNSKTLRKECINVGSEKSPDIPSRQTMESDILDKVYMDAFINKLDRYEQIVWDVYYQRGLISSGELADHFKISRVAAWQLKTSIINKYIDYVTTKEGI